jgi:hypothetical protein
MLIIDDPQRAEAADLIGRLALLLQSLQKAPDPVPPSKPVPVLTTARAEALTGLPVKELRRLALLSDDEFNDYLQRRADPAPELPLPPPMPVQAVSAPLSSITPSKAEAGLGDFKRLVRDITGQAAE